MNCSTTTTAIPGFLLPQLTWKRPLLRSFAVAVSKPSQALTPPFNPSKPRWAISPSLHQRQRHDTSTFRSLSNLPLFPPHKSLSSPPPPTRRPFSTTRGLLRDHHFDTLKFVQRLQEEGFSEDQARAVMLVLSDVIEESIQNLTRTMVLREGTYSPKVPSVSHPRSCRRRFRV